MSGFIPRHIEQPALRHSKPAARKISSRPSSSAWALTCAEPGTTIARSGVGDLAALDHRRRLAQVADAGVRAGADEDAVERDLAASRARARAPCSAAPAPRARERRLGSTAPVTSTTCPGVVPQVTIGASDAGVDLDLGVEARAVLGRQLAPALDRRNRSPPGARASLTHSKVVSSGAIMPARPPPSIVMLQIVIRSSIESASIVGPAYSTAWPTIPPVPRRPIVARIRSLG